MTKVIRTPQELKAWRKANSHQSIGFVPTMGALHRGHESLLQKARAENDVLVLSLFVNPTQFNDKKDFENYPLTWKSDLAVAEQNKVDVIFAPDQENMYPDHYRFKITESDFSRELCGKDRPGHFDGVLTVVMKLFHLVDPTRAYFGEKDFQQLTLIQEMVKAFFLSLEVIPVPTVREADGLALSSRNVRLTAGEREKAPLIHKTLLSAETAEEARRILSEQNWHVDYVTDRDGRRFAAVRLGSVRLIDNVKI